MNAPIVIGSRYELLEFVGKGGMGRVYRALDRQTGQSVAVKALKADVMPALQLERFHREAETLRLLEHPNIVSFLDSVEEHDGHYIVMEYVGGGSLQQLIEREGPLPLDRVLNIGLDLADALTRAHRLDIIHRDIKPANVLIATDGTPRLSDFGLARTGGPRITETGVIMGTVHYLCPEGVNGERLTALADIWALGIILFELLTAQHPFMHTRKDTLPMIMLAIMQQPVPDLELLRPDAPIALVDLVYRMLAKEVEARIPSARLVGAALEAILHGSAAGSAAQAAPASAVARDPEATQALRLGTVTPATAIVGPRHNLPPAATPFVGRETELSDLDALLVNPQARLITILGPGGMGKTRLALEAARRLLNDTHLRPFIADGLYFVDLAPLTGSAHIVPAVAESVGCQFRQGDDLQKQLVDFLRPQNILLLLDNFEHLIAGAGLVRTLLESAPGLQLLVTSRERLNLPEETVYRVGGMTFPDRPVDSNPAQHSAVRLFLQTAHRARPDFEPTRAHLEAIGHTCRLLDGMPLAVELAAAWIMLLSPQEIAAEVIRSADFLETDQRGVPDRHRSIRAVFDYSWNKLIEAERDAFMKLAVFRGGFTREAAEAVAGANLRLLMALINKSLLRRDPASGRFYMHELLRQYAVEQLAERPAERDALMRRYCAYYATYLEQEEHSLSSYNARAVLAELDNVHTAAEYMAGAVRSMGEAEQRAVAARLHSGLGEMLSMQGRYAEARRAFQQARAFVPDDAIKIAQMLVKESNTWSEQRQHFEEGLTLARQAYAVLAAAPQEDNVEWWRAQLTVLFAESGMYYWLARHEELDALLQQNLPLLEKYGTPAHRLSWLHALIQADLRRTRYRPLPALYGLLDRLLDAAQRINNADMLCVAYFMAGFCYLWLSELDQAEQYLRQSLEIADRTGDAELLLVNLIYLTVCARKRGQVGDVVTLGEKAYQLADTHQNMLYGGAAMGNQAWVAWREGRLEKAETLAREGLTRIRDASSDWALFWIALWPLLGVALRRDRVAEAVEFARALLAPPQQPPPPEIAALLTQAIEAWEQGSPGAARQHLDRAAELAAPPGYL